ncbi:hypothetical protein GCM10010995_04120 [Cysteiniphilum litorale]|uniref:Uncharacterized protein n=1 Tax=Cysteiniphilum litorale TaxID=2056700 RepID=A0A8J2Z2P0_9GAMM|nr:hypothetical protein GCM10010995_04120 [Cysteiniphilum litorale]
MALSLTVELGNELLLVVCVELTDAGVDIAVTDASVFCGAGALGDVAQADNNAALETMPSSVIFLIVVFLLLYEPIRNTNYYRPNPSV